MERDHAGSKQSNSFCGKICKAFSNACPLKKTRRVSYQHQQPDFPKTHHHVQATKQEAEMDFPHNRDHNREYRRSGTEFNTRVSDYIHRVGKKIRTTSFVGHEHADHVEENDEGSHLDDRATDYINRAKRKIRATTSSVGIGKRVTFKSNEK